METTSIYHELVATSTTVSKTRVQKPVSLPSTSRMIEYLGSVNYATTERVLEEIKQLMRRSAVAEIGMLVTSTGGPSGTAMSFFDTVRYILKPNLVTIGAGDVDSSGVILFLTGTRRYITPHTTLLFHSAGRIFDGNQRYTTREIDAMLQEDRLKDGLYADIVAEASRGALSADEVRSLMEQQTVLTAQDLVRYQLADGIIDQFTST